MTDDIAAFNAAQSKRLADADRNGTNDRADITTGTGYSRYDEGDNAHAE